MGRHGRLIKIIVPPVALFMALGYVLVLAFVVAPFFGMDNLRKPYVHDSRACPKSNVRFAEITGHFGLRIPADASEVRFFSDRHPTFGGLSLTLSFRTSPGGLREFLAGSLLEASDEGFEDEPGAEPGCGFDLSDLNKPSFITEDREAGFYRRAVAMEESGPRPRVLLEGWDGR